MNTENQAETLLQKKIREAKQKKKEDKIEDFRIVKDDYYGSFKVLKRSAKVKNDLVAALKEVGEDGLSADPGWFDYALLVNYVRDGAGNILFTDDNRNEVEGDDGLPPELISSLAESAHNLNSFGDGSQIKKK